MVNATPTTRLLILVGLLVSLALPINTVASQNPPNLYRVRRIFIRSQRSFEDDPIASNHLRPMMKHALESFGFIVVDKSTDADAVLDGEVGTWICFDCFDRPPTKGHKFTYMYRLEVGRFDSPSGSQIPSLDGTWETQVSVRSSSKLEADRFGLQKVARNLFLSWKQSAAKAGITVRDKLP